MAPSYIRGVPDPAVHPAGGGPGSCLEHDKKPVICSGCFLSASLGSALFVQGVCHVAPPVRPPLPSWDLNLVLSALQRAPFEDIRKIPLLTLSQKVFFFW